MTTKPIPRRAPAPDTRHSCALAFVPALPGPERLVALGFRYWLLESASVATGCRERLWDLYTGQFGIAAGRIAVAHLAAWATSVDRAAKREIEVFPEGCRSFCRDQCIAVSMIAACQHQTCPAMRACAMALAERAALETVLEDAQTFASTLLALDQVLLPASIAAIANAAPPPGTRIQ